jgi:hypothetical protein
MVLVGFMVLAGCTDDCDTSCLPNGTYVEANDELGVASATICFDDDCKTLRPGEDDGGGGIDGNVTDGFYRGDSTEDRSFKLTIEVFDAAGNSIDAVTEDREMNSGECRCGVLYYEWKDGQLHRVS